MSDRDSYIVIVAEFRAWNRKWELFEYGIGRQPPNVDKFIEQLQKRYVIKLK